MSRFDSLWLNLIFLAILAILGPLVQGTFLETFLIIWFVYFALASSWNIIGGIGGQISLGHAAFFGLGAFGAAISIVHGYDIGSAIVIGAGVAALFSVLVSPMFRLRGAYFSLGTLSLTEIVLVIALNLKITGGGSGLLLPASSAISNTAVYFIGLVIAGGSLLTTWAISRSRIGLALRAIRGNEDAAQFLGVNPFYYKLVAFAISSFFAGAIGSVYAVYIFFIEPSSIFSLSWAATPVIAVMIGGSGTLLGPLIGSLLVFALTQITVGFNEISLVVFGGLLIIIVTVFPLGIVGTAQKIFLSSAKQFQQITSGQAIDEENIHNKS